MFHYLSIHVSICTRTFNFAVFTETESRSANAQGQGGREGRREGWKGQRKPLGAMDGDVNHLNIGDRLIGVQVLACGTPHVHCMQLIVGPFYQ